MCKKFILLPLVFLINNIMFEFIEGTFESITPSFIVVNSNGVGYKIEISLCSYSIFKSMGKGRVLVHFVVREDAQLLFGFATDNERMLFRQLIAVSGIGANTARMMLSSLNSEELINAIVTEDVSAIKAIKGIGLKTAQRVIIELKDSLSKIEISSPSLNLSNKNKQEALLALQTLGFNKLLVERTLEKILLNAPTADCEMLIKQALKVL
jgi:Holliday junction DNA helicase RuvA